MDLAFSHFVLGCFRGIGSQAARFLCTLAFLELRQHDALLVLATLEPPSPSDGSQLGPGVLDRRLRDFSGFGQGYCHES